MSHLDLLLKTVVITLVAAATALVVARLFAIPVFMIVDPRPVGPVTPQTWAAEIAISTLFVMLVAAFAMIIIGIVRAMLRAPLVFALRQKNRRRWREHEAKRPYFLYLRGFDGERLNWTTTVMNLRWAFLENPESSARLVLNLSPFREALDEALAICLDKDGPLVGLRSSRRMALSGAIEIASRHEDWREVFSRLLAGATTVFLVPGTTPGVMEELLKISCNEELARKTILVVPPSDARSSFAEAWQAVRAQCKEAGLQWQAPDRTGFLMLLSTDECVSWGLLGSSHNGLKKAIKLLLKPQDKYYAAPRFQPQPST